MTALFTESEIRLKNGIRWMEFLSRAYPEDAAMSCILYYLKRRLSKDDPQVLEELRKSALLKIEKSEYWQKRNAQFKFSRFLEGVVPEVPAKVLEDIG